MPFSTKKFFSLLADHLEKRSDNVAHLTTMAAIERWVQFEGAALLSSSAGRTECGITGGTSTDPRWWVVCEYKTVDLLVQGPRATVAIEFKAVHNNKNFRNKVREIRWDLSKPLDSRLDVDQRSAIAVVAYARYHDSDRYKPLRMSPRGPLVESSRLGALLKEALASDDDYYRRLPGARVVKWRRIADLEGAPYVERGCGAYAALALIERES
jgi:hypothetical protein